MEDLPEKAIQQVKVTKRKFLFRKTETDEIMINLKHENVHMDDKE